MSNRKTCLSLGLAGLLAAGVAGVSRAQNANGPFVQNPASLAETAKAEALISKDPVNLSAVGMLCRPLKEIFTVGLAIPTPPASRAFDNLYYLGTGSVGAWALDTNDGLIVIDALDNSAEAKSYIEGGLRSLGLDPQRIRYVLVSHGHSDHFGGARYLQETFHAHVLMSPADWALTARASNLMNGHPPERPEHDMDVTDGQRLTLGDTTLTLYITPGHTPGTVSAILPVKDRARTRVISFWGGTAFPADVSMLPKYQASVARFTRIARAAGVVGVISNHPVFDASVTKLAEAAAHPNAPNPFVLGELGTSRYYEVLAHCLKAQIDRQSPPH
jgi:metallo-beta-lactamase class B